MLRPACSSARESTWAPSRSCCSRWKAMREADLTPTPGRRRSASISAWREGSAKSSEGELHPRGQARGELAHLFLAGLFGLAHRGVEGRGHEVFQHVLVLAQQAGVDGHALDVVLAGHDDLHEAGARLAAHLDGGELFLR